MVYRWHTPFRGVKVASSIGHNFTMQLFFFLNFQYFQKKLAKVLDVPIHNLPRKITIKIIEYKSVFC